MYREFIVAERAFVICSDKKLPKPFTFRFYDCPLGLRAYATGFALKNR